jgi:hypothetical protein
MTTEIATSPMFRVAQPQSHGLVIPPGSEWDSSANGGRFYLPAHSSGNGHLHGDSELAVLTEEMRRDRMERVACSISHRRGALRARTA